MMVDASLRKTMTLRQFAAWAGMLTAGACGLLLALHTGKSDWIGPWIVVWIVELAPAVLLAHTLVYLGAKWRGKSTAIRFAAMVGVAVSIATLLVLVILPFDFVPCAAIPTFVMAMLCERKTRTELYVSEITHKRVRISPIVFGGVLGVLNCAFCAFGFAWGQIGGDRLTDFRIVFAIGLVPAIGCGVVVGLIANATARISVIPRVVILLLPTLGFLAMGASLVRFDDRMLGLACIPTIVGVLIIERESRIRPDPELPQATIAR
ncbi:MAG: hypothetical protein QM831_34365 [Kofleriaceae bacterium]